MDQGESSRREWLEADGLGGFSSGTAGLVRTRRYHGILVAAVDPPGRRRMRVPCFDESIDVDGARCPLSTHDFGDITHPDGVDRVLSFSPTPWPTWTFDLGEGRTLRRELVHLRERRVTVVRWSPQGFAEGILDVRPFVTNRPMHRLLRAPVTAFAARGPLRSQISFWLDGEAVVSAFCEGTFVDEPLTYGGFHLRDERERGFDFTEDLHSAGYFTLQLRGEPVTLVLVAGGHGEESLADTKEISRSISNEAARRDALGGDLHRAADQYVVRRGRGHSLIAGYPWFADWGRDTFIAMRGLVLATGRGELAVDILRAWSDSVSDGMLPNRFSDEGQAAEYNSVDSSLWFVVVAGEVLDGDLLEENARQGLAESLRPAILAILEAYRRGTRHGIRSAADGLLFAGEVGQQLTWMDARVAGCEITPRIGKPVELQALWYNALAVGARFDPAYAELAERVRRVFPERFFDSSRGYCCDVADAAGEGGADDWSLRPNQILAVGGLPRPLLDGAAAAAVVDTVESRLWTPLGLRSLAPDDERYAERYVGGPHERDAVYHQGTVWPWLMGSFVDAWVRVHGDRAEARERFLSELLAHLDDAGLGHVSEIADGAHPHLPRGAPFQAWSLGELIRSLERTELS